MCPLIARGWCLSCLPFLLSQAICTLLVVPFPGGCLTYYIKPECVTGTACGLFSALTRPTIPPFIVDLTSSTEPSAR